MSKITAKPPKRCDLCGADLMNLYPGEPSVCYDGRTARGHWAWMCVDCFSYMGTGLGTGRGQKYVYNQEDKAWYKEEG